MKYLKIIIVLIMVVIIGLPFLLCGMVFRIVKSSFEAGYEYAGDIISDLFRNT